MVIFIRNIPEMTLPSELEQFVAPALKSVLPFIRGKIIKAEVLILLDTRTKLHEYHGLVHIEPEKAGHLAIKKLNGKRLRDKIVIVREYVERRWQNDRRTDHANVCDVLGQGHRKNDRRRGKQLEIVQDVSSMFSASKEHTRKLL